MTRLRDVSKIVSDDRRNRVKAEGRSSRQRIVEGVADVEESGERGEVA